MRAPFTGRLAGGARRQKLHAGAEPCVSSSAVQLFRQLRSGPPARAEHPAESRRPECTDQACTIPDLAGNLDPLVSVIIPAYCEENVIEQQQALKAAATATFATRQSVPVLLRPALPLAAAACLIVAGGFILEKPDRASKDPGVTAEVDQVERTLQDLEMLRQFKIAGGQ